MTISSRNDLKAKISTSIDRIKNYFSQKILIGKELTREQKRISEILNYYLDETKSKLIYMNDFNLEKVSGILNEFEIFSKKIDIYNADQNQIIEIQDKIKNHLEILLRIDFEYIYDESYTKDDFVQIMTIVEQQTNYRRYPELVNFVHEHSYKNIDSIFQDLITIRNYLQKGYQSNNEIFSKIFERFDSLLNNRIGLKNKVDELDRIQKEIEEAKNSLEESKIKMNDVLLQAQQLNSLNEKVSQEISNNQNNRLLAMFYDEYKEHENPIQALNSIIIFSFITILCIYLLLFLLEIYPKDTKQYFMYISSLLFGAGFIGYLVKERIRLIKFHDYSKKLYLETNAMSDYMASLDVEQSKALRIELAKNYFTGSGIEPTKENTSQDTSQLLKNLEEIKRLIGSK